MQDKTRLCQLCDAALVRREKETAAEFLRRKFCSAKCAALNRCGHTPVRITRIGDALKEIGIAMQRWRIETHSPRRKSC